MCCCNSTPARIFFSRVTSLFFADDGVLLAVSHEALQASLDWFADECEAVVMQMINTPKSESMVYSQKMMACPLQGGVVDTPQLKEFLGPCHN